MDPGMNGVIRIWWCHLLWLGIIENRRKVAKRRQVELMLLPGNMWFATLGTRPESESLPFNKSLIECFSCRYVESWIMNQKLRTCSEVKLEWCTLQRFSFLRKSSSENVDFFMPLGKKRKGNESEFQTGSRKCALESSVPFFLFLPLPPFPLLLFSF